MREGKASSSQRDGGPRDLGSTGPPSQLVYASHLRSQPRPGLPGTVPSAANQDKRKKSALRAPLARTPHGGRFSFAVCSENLALLSESWNPDPGAGEPTKRERVPEARGRAAPGEPTAAAHAGPRGHRSRAPGAGPCRRTRLDPSTPTPRRQAAPAPSAPVRTLRTPDFHSRSCPGTDSGRRRRGPRPGEGKEGEGPGDGSVGARGGDRRALRPGEGREGRGPREGWGARGGDGRGAGPPARRPHLGLRPSSWARRAAGLRVRSAPGPAAASPAAAPASAPRAAAPTRPAAPRPAASTQPPPTAATASPPPGRRRRRRRGGGRPPEDPAARAASATA